MLEVVISRELVADLVDGPDRACVDDLVEAFPKGHERGRRKTAIP
jgi:hypothetical protein